MDDASQPTPSQTVGPFFGYALPYRGGTDIVAPWQDGAITLHGTVFDGAGVPVPDAILEIWQADPAGKLAPKPGSVARDGVTFTGFGRAATDAEGHYLFHTMRPGPVNDRDGGAQAPHLSLAVFARGVTLHLFTRVYFPDATEANRADPMLSTLPADRARTLLAQHGPDGTYRFDVRLQGERETVFLDIR